jgi:hypothetical protein
MSTDYDRLSAAVNRPSERPIVADEWSAKADNWLLTADVLSPILAKQFNPLHNLEHDMNLQEIIKFNSGRRYSEAGQRIAACEIQPGIVYMQDVDRGVDYILRCELDQYSIMHAYDRADVYAVYCSDLDGFTYQDKQTLRDELTAIALTAKRA